MTDEIENLILEHLRVIRGDVQKLKADAAEMMSRLGSIEGHLAIMQGDLARTFQRIDSQDERLSRIEQRLNLVDA